MNVRALIIVGSVLAYGDGFTRGTAEPYGKDLDPCFGGNFRRALGIAFMVFAIS